MRLANLLLIAVIVLLGTASPLFAVEGAGVGAGVGMGLSIVAQETLYRAGTAASRRQTAGPTAAGSGLDTPARQRGSS